MKRIFFCLMVLLVMSCNKVNVSNIPYAPVYFKVHLTGIDHDLNGSLKYKEFTSARSGGEKVGFSGIFVVCGHGGNTYYAYDLCCPHEGKNNIKVIPSDSGTAECPKCGTVYDIAWGIGQPLSGPSEFTLQGYDITKVNGGSELIIRN